MNTSIDFQDAANYTSVTTQYQSRGVTFAGSGPYAVKPWGDVLQNVASPSNQTAVANATSLAVTYFRQGAGGTANPAPTMTLTFSPPVEGATLTFYAKTMNDVVGVAGSDTLTVKSYDVSNLTTALETRTLQTNVQYPNPFTDPTKTYAQRMAEQKVTFTKGKIAKVVLSDAFTTGVAIDDLSFAPAHCNDASCNGDTVPSSLLTGQSFNATINVQNIGNTTWTGPTYYLAYSAGTTPLSSWGLSNGGATWSGWPNAQIAKNDAPYVDVHGTAPSTPGTYTFRWQMAENGVEFFGPVCGKSIAVRAPVNNATCTATVPTTATPGQVFPVTFVMSNNGDITWASPTHYLLDTDTGSPDWGVNKQDLTSSVATGGSQTFTFNVTAPQTPGTYPLKWAMAQDGVGNFGQMCGEDVVVAEIPTSDLVFSGGVLPTTMVNGSTANMRIAIRNDGPALEKKAHFEFADYDASFDFLTVTGPQGYSCNVHTNPTYCTITDLAVGETRTYTAAVKAVASGCPADSRAQMGIRAEDPDDVKPWSNAGPMATVHITCPPVSSSSSSAPVVSSSSVSSVSSSAATDNAQCMGIDLPDTIIVGRNHIGTVTFKNTGTTTWPIANAAFERGYVSGGVTVLLPNTVVPGQSVTVPISVYRGQLGQFTVYWGLRKPGADTAFGAECQKTFTVTTASSSSVQSSSSSSRSSSASSIVTYCCSTLTGYCTPSTSCTQTYDQCLTSCVASRSSSSIFRSSSSSSSSRISSSSRLSSSSVQPPPSSSSSLVVSSSSRSSAPSSSSRSSVVTYYSSWSSVQTAVSSVVHPAACDGRGCLNAGYTVCGFIGAQCREIQADPCYVCERPSVSSQAFLPPIPLPPASSVSSAQESSPGLVFNISLGSAASSGIRAPFCGDGVTQPPEQCDLASTNSDRPNALCRTNCAYARCGDGIVDTSAEACDDGNTTGGDGCSSTCRQEQRSSAPSILAQVFDVQPQTPPPSPVAPQIIYPQTIVYAQPPATANSGPASAAVMAAGAATGLAYMRRKRKQ